MLSPFQKKELVKTIDPAFPPPPFFASPTIRSSVAEFGNDSEKTRKSAERAHEKSQAGEPVSPTRSRASEEALKREPRNAASRSALSRQARSAAQRRSGTERSAAVRKGAQTKREEPHDRDNS